MSIDPAAFPPLLDALAAWEYLHRPFTAPGDDPSCDDPFGDDPCPRWDKATVRDLVELADEERRVLGLFPDLLE